MNICDSLTTTEQYPMICRKDISTKGLKEHSYGEGRQNTVYEGLQKVTPGSNYPAKEKSPNFPIMFLPLQTLNMIVSDKIAQL